MLGLKVSFMLYNVFQVVVCQLPTTDLLDIHALLNKTQQKH